MGRRKREPMSEGKKNIIAGLLQEYDIKMSKDFSGIEQKIISLYAKGMTTRQISETIEDIYGFEVSDGMVSDITDRLLPQIEDWQNRPLDEVYPIVFIDAVHFSVRNNGQIQKLAAYVILAVSLTGHKEVLSIHIGENESAKYWLGVLNEQRSVFPSDTALLKALYLATHEIAKKWTVPLRNWGRVLGELEIMYPDRLG